MNEQGDMVVCVAQASERENFQPFVEAHVARLPARIEVLCGRDLNADGEGRRIGPGRLRLGIARGVRHFTGLSLPERLNRRARGRFLKRRGVDVVLAEFGPTGVAMQGACRRAGVPFVVHFHGYDACKHDVLDRFAAGYVRMFRGCAAVVAVSRPMQEQLIRLGAPPEKVRYNPYGVDLERFTPTDAGANPPLFVAVGRFVEKKAPQLTLLAFRRALDACPDARLLMVGDGVLLDACRDIVVALGLSDAVELAGRLPHERVAEALAGARAFVQHSITPESGDCEGMPNAILEAGACALPVVSTRHAGIPDAVVEGETGFLVDERDVAGMAAHMTTLARDPALAGRMGAAARERMAAEFSMDKRIRALWDILVEAADRR
jgi:colanic acid/amylovoran biosynthesis glycosyltransferase